MEESTGPHVAPGPQVAAPGLLSRTLSARLVRRSYVNFAFY